jgi:hypothetical protein
VITESFRYDKNLLLSFSVLRFFNREGNGTFTGWKGGVDGDEVTKGGCSRASLPTSPFSS